MASTSLVGAQTLQTLYSFSGIYRLGSWNLTLGPDGNFYGTTELGGITNSSYIGGMGTVFKVTTNGMLTTLVSFNYSLNGAYPEAGLTLGNDGNFYGTTSQGGIIDENQNIPYGMGTVFQITTNGTLTMLVSFNGTNGANPQAALTLGNDGNFYGTTEGGGRSGYDYGNGYGTVFKVTTKGKLTTLVYFNPNGERPEAGLTLGNDGNFYGTTKWGGIGDGVVFKVTTNGTLTWLASFWDMFPSGLTLGNDGNFYGTTEMGGFYDNGTVFKVTTNGMLTTLVYFKGTNGANPEAGLTLGNDGNFYGTTEGGGIGSDGGSFSGNGTVFMVTTNGMLTTLVYFNGTNGAYPAAGLTLGPDGNFYGSTEDGGSSSNGTVFRLLLPPDITVQPQSQTNNAGATVTFLVSATSLIPLSYQWQKSGTNLVNGGDISGANSNALTVTGISDSDAASYSVIVSNANFSITNYATLTVIDPPKMVLQFLAGYPVLSLNGMLSNNFVVQYSTNLAGSNWINLLSLTNLSASPYLFLDPAGVEQPARFYRAFMQ